MTVAQRRSPDRMTAPERRQQILDVTTEIISDQGFQGVSIESAARGAGVSRALVYEHFGHLRGLLTAVVDREMTRALSQVSETKLTDLSESDPQELMLDSLRAYLHAVRDHPTTWRMVLMSPEGAPELLRKSIRRGRAIVLASLTQALEPALLRNRNTPDADLTARILSAIADEYARLVLTDPARFPPERLLVHARWYLDHATLKPTEGA